MNQIDLSNRHAVVTGAAQGIGRVIARRLLVSGASVSLWDREEDAVSSARLQLEVLGPVSTEKVDVADTSSVETATKSTLQQHGTIDILVANAGVARPNHMTWEYSIEAWKRVIEVTLIGVFLCCRAIVPQMLKQCHGRIVNVASIAGTEGNASASVLSR